MSKQTPREIDTAIAAKYHELERAEQQLAYSNSDMFSLAGARLGYQGRRRAYFTREGRVMTLEDAIQRAALNVNVLKAYMASHSYTEHRCYEVNGQTVEYDYEGTNWDDYEGSIAPYEKDRALEAFEKRAKCEDEIGRIRDEIDALQEQYTGWSRFFVVTSSAGHVHSSMHCHTCRPTTTYGWLPELSGKDEAEAVKELGPALCSVCFPSAPLDWQGGKLTKAQAEKKAA